MMVMENAANHAGKGNADVDEWLWGNHAITALLIPTRMPEWNPIKLLWRSLTLQLPAHDWEQLRSKNRAACAAALVLHSIRHRDVEVFYAECTVFHLHCCLQLLDE